MAHHSLQLLKAVCLAGSKALMVSIKIEPKNFPEWTLLDQPWQVPERTKGKAVSVLP